MQDFRKPEGVQDFGPVVEGAPKYTPSPDMTSAADVAGAPESGEKSVLLQAVVSTDTAMLFLLQAETPGDERIPIRFPSGGGTYTFIPRHPTKTPAGEKWQGLASAVGNVEVHTIVTSEA